MHDSIAPLGICRRSPVSTYSQLIDDVPNDITRMPQFFAVAARARSGREAA